MKEKTEIIMRVPRNVNVMFIWFHIFVDGIMKLTPRQR